MKKELKERASKLRLSGESVNNISKILGVAKSTVSVWTRGITLTDEQKEKLLKREIKDEQAIALSNFFKNKRMSFQQKGRDKIKLLEPLYIAGCMLYWGEGSKSINTCQLTNSELPMLVVFKNFLVKYFDVSDEMLSVNINAYTDLKSETEIKNYWLNGLNLPESSLKSTTWNCNPKSSKNVSKKLEYGTCAIRVYKTEIVQEILGAIQQFGDFQNIFWLIKKDA